MGVKLAAASGGSIELVPTNTASTFTVTVPALTGTMLTTSTAGTVLQVVQGTTNTTVSVSTGGYTDTGLTATITPTSATSKILVFINQAFYTSISAGSQYGGIRILRGSTVIFYPLEYGGAPDDFGVATYGSAVYNRGSINYQDSPATTSAVTYKTQGRPYNTSGTMVFQPTGDVNGTSTIILMEIAA
jgi:hypothetical protein